MARKGRTFDQEGNQLGILPGEKSGTPDEWSLGASMFEFFNPGTVQQEDVAIGAPPRSYTEIMGDAVSGMVGAAEETRQQIGAEAKRLATTVGPVIVIGLVAAAVLAVALKRR